MSNIETGPSYIELVCETIVNPTENEEKVTEILKRFLEGKITVDERFDGKYLVVRNSDWDGLKPLSEWIRRARLLDTVRRRLLKSSIGNLTAIYFNKQAAAMHKLSLVDVNDNPPLGSISYQIISDDLEYVINKFTPKTYEGKELSKEQWEVIKNRKIENRNF